MKTLKYSQNRASDHLPTATPIWGPCFDIRSINVPPNTDHCSKRSLFWDPTLEAGLNVLLSYLTRISPKMISCDNPNARRGGMTVCAGVADQGTCHTRVTIGCKNGYQAAMLLLLMLLLFGNSCNILIVNLDVEIHFVVKCRDRIVACRNCRFTTISV